MNEDTKMQKIRALVDELQMLLDETPDMQHAYANESLDENMAFVEFSQDGSSARATKFLDKSVWIALNKEMERRGFKWFTDKENKAQSRWVRRL